jgi:O-antigen ligase
MTMADTRLLLALEAACLAAVIAAAGATSSRAALLGVGALAGLVGVAAIVRFAPRRACDSLLLLFIGLVTIPVDSYLGYRDHTGGWPGFRVSVADLCLYLALVPAMLGASIGRVENAMPRRVLVCMGLLFLHYVFSASFAAEPMLSTFEIAGMLHGFLIALVVAGLLRRDLVLPLLVLIAIQVVAHSGLAVAQAITGRPIGAGWLGGNPEVLSEAFEGGTAHLRPAGLFTHPIVFAMSLVVALPLLIAGMAIARGLVVRVLFCATVAVATVGLALTLSRGAWLSGIVGLVLLAVFALRCRLVRAQEIRAIAVATLVAAVVLGAAFGPRVYERITGSAAGNVEVRLDLNRIAMRMALAHPLVGTGLNNFVETMAPYDPTNVKSYFPAPVHNLYLLEAAEAGVPALVLWLVLFASILLAGLDRLPRMRDPSLQWVAAAAMAALMGFLVSQVADFSHRIEPLRSLLWLNVGLLFGVLHVDDRMRDAAAGRMAE